MATYTDQLVVYDSGSIKKIAAQDVLVFGDSTELALGAGSDLKLYHDGTDSYITNATGDLKIATETSGVAITIGHTTSEVTIADNLTVTGNLTVSGETTTVSTTNTVVADKLFELGNGTTGTPSGDAGIVIERGDSDNAIIAWDESADVFVLGTTTATGASSGDLTITAAGLSISALTLGGTAVTSTAAELNLLDGVTATTAELNILDGVTATAAELNILDGVTASAAEINLLDATAGSSLTLAAGDGFIINDASDSNATKKVLVSDLTAFFASSGSTAADNITAGSSAVEITTTSGDVVVDAPSGQSVDLQVAGANVVEVAGDRVDISQDLVLGANGVIEITEGGPSTASISAGLIVAAHHSSNNDTLVTADQATAANSDVIGVALEAISGSGTYKVASLQGCSVTVKKPSSGDDSIVAGTIMYLSTSGLATSAVPTSNVVHRLGYAIEASNDTAHTIKIVWAPQFIADLG